MSELNLSTEENTIVHTSEAGVITLVRQSGCYESITPESSLLVSSTRFQDGTIAENGANGTTLEGHLAIAFHRLNELNSKFHSPYNEAALTNIKQAIEQLEARTADRVARGVDGQHVL